MSMWQAFTKMTLQFRELQQMVTGKRGRVRNEPDQELPDSDLSEREQHEAIEREAARREMRRD